MDLYHWVHALTRFALNMHETAHRRHRQYTRTVRKADSASGRIHQTHQTKEHKGEGTYRRDQSSHCRAEEDGERRFGDGDARGPGRQVAGERLRCC
jgi:hypothetical protein